MRSQPRYSRTREAAAALSSPSREKRWVSKAESAAADPDARQRGVSATAAWAAAAEDPIRSSPTTAIGTMNRLITSI